MKRMFAMVLSVLMLVSVAVPASAALPDDQVAPCWENMTQVTVDIEFGDDNVGNASVIASRVFGITTSIEGTLTVYYKSGSRWVYVDEVSGDNNGSLYLELEFDAVSGRQYKAVADITAHSDTSSESETLTKTRTCP